MPGKTYLAAVLALAVQYAKADKCYAVAFSSGDESAAYQAGALKGLTESYGADAVAYSAISGISGGAVNAAILAAYAAGAEADASARMIKFWQDASNSELYKNWLGGIAEGLLIKGGLYNDSELMDFLKSDSGLNDIQPNQRWLDIGITDVLKGTYKDMHSEDLTGEDFYNVMYAEFAYAGFFPPVNAMGSEWFDGSTIWDLDIFSAVNKCLETHSDKDVVVDVIMTSAKTLKTVDASQYKSIHMLWRYLEVSRYYSSMDGLLRAQFAYPNITFRNIIAPTADLPSSLYPLNLKQTDIDSMVTLGESDAKASAAAGPQTISDTFHYFSLKKQGDNSVSGVNFDDFVSRKANGEFGDYNVLEDEHMQALFLQ